MRAFLAVELSPAVKAACRRLGKELSGALPTARWVRAGQLHLTLSFLGNIDDDQRDALREACLRGPLSESFELHVAGLGAFPREDRARVVWAGAVAGNRELRRLAGAVCAAATAAGVGGSRENPYIPHVTLARLVRTTNLRTIEVFRVRRETEMGVCRVTEVVLFRSRLEPEGACYEPIWRVGLSAPGDMTRLGRAAPA